LWAGATINRDVVNGFGTAVLLEIIRKGGWQKKLGLCQFLLATVIAVLKSDT
jgi:hypothetical protein